MSEDPRGEICPRCKILMRPTARSTSHITWQCPTLNCGYWMREPIAWHSQYEHYGKDGEIHGKD